MMVNIYTKYRFVIYSTSYGSYVKIGKGDIRIVSNINTNMYLICIHINV